MPRYFYFPFGLWPWRVEFAVTRNLNGTLLFWRCVIRIDRSTDFHPLFHFVTCREKICMSHVTCYLPYLYLSFTSFHLYSLPNLICLLSLPVPLSAPSMTDRDLPQSPRFPLLVSTPLCFPSLPHCLTFLSSPVPLLLPFSFPLCIVWRLTPHPYSYLIPSPLPSCPCSLALDNLSPPYQVLNCHPVYV